MAAAPAPKGKGIGGALGRKVGPLPLWAWVGLAVAGLAVGLYIRRHMESSSTTAQTASPSSATTGDLGDMGSGALGTSSGSGTGDNGVAPFTPHIFAGGGGGQSAQLADQQQFESSLIGELQSEEASIAAAFSKIGTSGAGAGSTTPGSLTPVYAAQGPGLTQTSPLFQTSASPTGIATVGASGVLQPAYADPGSATGYVSPITYAGAGVTPQPVTSSEVAPPVTSGLGASVSPVQVGSVTPVKVTVPKSSPGGTVPLSAAGAKKTGTNPKTTGTLH